MHNIQIRFFNKLTYYYFLNAKYNFFFAIVNIYNSKLVKTSEKRSIDILILYPFELRPLKMISLQRSVIIIGISGLLLKNIGSTNASLSNHAVDCILWFNKNRKNKEDFHTYSQRLPMWRQFSSMGSLVLGY